MRRQTKSLLQELSGFSSNKDIELTVEARATHIINSAIHLLDLIKENFSNEEALDLERRLLNSIKSSDTDKFKRGIKRIQESKRSKNSKII
jgi:hypothetical protein